LQSFSVVTNIISNLWASFLVLWCLCMYSTASNVYANWGTRSHWCAKNSPSLLFIFPHKSLFYDYVDFLMLNNTFTHGGGMK